MAELVSCKACSQHIVEGETAYQVRIGELDYSGQDFDFEANEDYGYYHTGCFIEAGIP